MCGRSRRKLGILLLLASIGLFVVACGGEDEETTTTSRSTTVTTTNPDGQSGEDDMVGTRIKTTDDTPSAFVEAYGAQPIVVCFFVQGGRDDQLVWDSLQALQPAFPSYAFFYYSFSESELYGDLSRLLKVGYTPEITMFDDSGTIQYRWSGYVDEGSLNQSLVNIGRE